MFRKGNFYVKKCMMMYNSHKNIKLNKISKNIFYLSTDIKKFKIVRKNLIKNQQNN